MAAPHHPCRQLLCLLLLLWPGVVWAYTPPLGIPDPAASFATFGAIDQATPAWPASWGTVPTTATADTYYVDKTDPSCTNSANPYGHPDLPRCMFPEGALPAGAYVYIHAGTYTNIDSAGDRFDWCGPGTASAPIWITGNATTHPVLTDKAHIGQTCNTSYLVVENLDFTGAPATITVAPTTDGVLVDHVLVRHLTRTGTGATGDQFGLLIGPSSASDTIPTSTIAYVVAYDLTVSTVGLIDPGDVGADEPGVYVGYHTSYVWILDSTLHHVGADGVAGSHYSNNTDRLTDHVYIGGNTIYQNGENCVDIKTTDEVVVSQNTCYGPFQDENGWGIVLHYGANFLPTTHVWVLFNTIYDAGAGVVCTLCADVHVLGNVISHVADVGTGDVLDGSCVGFRATDGVLDVIDNTCDDFETGVAVANATLSSGDLLTMHGNILSNRTLAGGYELWVENNGEQVYVDIDYAQVYAPINAAAFYWAGASRDLAYLQGTASECANCLESDPVYDGVAATALHLTATSPAIGANAAWAGYAAYLSTYGLSIQYDHAAVSRPIGGSWDLGASEYAAAPPPGGAAALTGVTLTGRFP